ncbi:MAG: hypothetical protein KC493_09495 [Bacteriovoracaceae bacterium]|nr:hypothetical protein [Bacteriovoracaceae bacterium]
MNHLFKEGKTLDFDLDQLAKETFELTKRSENKSLIEEERARSALWAEDVPECPTLLEEDIFDEALPLAPQGPGLVYRVDKGSSTFCVRGFATENIEQSLLDIESGEVVTREKLRLDDDLDYDTLNFFETDELAMAQIIIDQLFNRRFPIDEDILCNLSDPGFSWWLNLDEVGLNIFFKSHGLNRMDRFSRLGPIGDNAIACLRLNQASSFLRTKFAINEFSCDDKSLNITPVESKSLGYQNFLELLVDGEFNWSIEDFSNDTHGRTMYFYFKELAALRAFWINLEEILEDLD